MCFDLYGERTDYDKKSKVLTQKKLPYQVVDSYALTLKPHEMNYLCGLKGNDIHLYDLTLPREEEKQSSEAPLCVVNYYYNYFPSIKNLVALVCVKVCIKLKKLRGKLFNKQR